MSGLVEDVLTERYGSPMIVTGLELTEYRWNDDREAFRCHLYKPPALHTADTGRFVVLRRVYGDALGASLLLGSLRLAMVAGPRVYGLYAIDELRAQPEVRQASIRDPEIEFFMDASNVWFYGMKGRELYCYDSETGELYGMGDFEEAFRELLDSWEQAAAS